MSDAVFSDDALSDKELTIRALIMYANWVQTGDPILAPSDLNRFKSPKTLRDVSIRVLGEDQKELVRRLRGIAATL